MDLNETMHATPMNTINNVLMLLLVHRGAVKADRKWRCKQIYRYLEGLYWWEIFSINFRKYPDSQPYVYAVVGGCWLGAGDGEDFSWSLPTTVAGLRWPRYSSCRAVSAAFVNSLRQRLRAFQYWRSAVQVSCKWKRYAEALTNRVCKWNGWIM